MRSPEELREIERHKYFLSEKQGRDVGWEYAERDWEENYGESFRASRGHRGASARREAPAAEREESSHTATAVAEEEPPRELERDAHRVAPRGEARPQPRTELTTSSPAPASTSPEPAPQNETPQPSAGKPGSVFVRLRNLLGRKKA